MGDPRALAQRHNEDELVGAIQEMVLTMDRDKDETGAQVIVANEAAAEQRAVHAPEAVESTTVLEAWPKPSSGTIYEIVKKARFSLFCRICGEEGKFEDFMLCGGCGAPHMPAHRKCLASFRPHRPNDPGPALYTEPCEEVNFEEFAYTASLLDSRLLDEDKTALHVDDLWSTWFGVPHNQQGPLPQLHIYPRLQHLISINPNPQGPPRQYPSLISLVGDTGSGKSTLIRAIIRMLAPRAHKDYRVPVPGSAHDGFDSTSSDVHLFSDPGTISSRTPLFLVDCEGFSGTDTPMSRKLLSDAQRSEASQHLREGTLRGIQSTKPAKDPQAEHAATATVKVDLKWGQVVATVEHSIPGRKTLGEVAADTRKVLVKNLYPRLLYAFSDVVCFVTNNSRQSQTILEEMFKWAKDGHERTLNQRIRPGLIIVLNKMAQDSHDVLSSSERATLRLLESFEKSARFTELQKKWAARGREVKTAEDLMLCYYSDFRVISIPQHIPSSPATGQKISSQIKELYREIRAMSDRIRKQRQTVNMDLDVASLNAYLNQSVRTLASDYNNSLDFYRLSDGDTGLPRRFSEHLVQLMAGMVKLKNLHTTQAVGGEAQMVTQMIPYLAACIVAQADQKNGKEEVQKSKEALVDETRRGLEHFRDRFWRCEAKDKSGLRRCKNYLEGHEKGHQFDRMDSLAEYSRPSNVSEEDTLEVGRFRCSYNPDAIRDLLWEEVTNLRNRDHAIDKLAYSATAAGVTGITGQRSCLACLSNTPTNMLPCRPKQHGICESCIRRYNPNNGEESVIQIGSCPLGCSLTKTPWCVRVKPRSAGARILALDGGGVRGIVELAILSQIEKEIGLGIHIQDLFDLVIGTSTGGIIALGVFENGWSMGKASQAFRSLAQSAFTKRKTLSVPILSKFAEPFCDHKYKSKGINEALKSAFGKDFLFGCKQGASDSSGNHVKIGVVSCVEGRLQACLITNYSRNPPEKLKDGREGFDMLQREDEQEKDFLTWQAARATSAAPTLFKPYIHEPTDRIYVDGATVHNNPVRVAYEEQKQIWNQDMPPDIIVSIGTGILVDKDGNVVVNRSDRLASVKRMLPRGVRKKVETGIDMVEATLNCHREWVNFHSTLRGRLRKNSHRLDVGLRSKPPALDDLESMWPLMQETDTYLYNGQGQNQNFQKVSYLHPDYALARDHIQAVARRLKASLFYLSHVLDTHMEGGVYQGTIYCRLTPRSAAARALIAQKPRFRLHEIGKSRSEAINPIEEMSSKWFSDSTLSGRVEIRVSDGEYQRLVEVQFPNREDHWEPIGGF